MQIRFPLHKSSENIMEIPFQILNLKSEEERMICTTKHVSPQENPWHCRVTFTQPIFGLKHTMLKGCSTLERQMLQGFRIKNKSHNHFTTSNIFQHQDPGSP